MPLSTVSKIGIVTWLSGGKATKTSVPWRSEPEAGLNVSARRRALSLFDVHFVVRPDP
jgi:hypothetical protein